jgi:hypothetical protein
MYAAAVAVAAVPDETSMGLLLGQAAPVLRRLQEGPVLAECQ